MSKKGVSAVIATILILMIAIALSGTAYIYFSGIVTGRTAKTISISDASCNGTHITLVVINDGTQDMSDSDLQVLVDNVDRSASYDFGTINSHDTTTVTGTENEGSGEHTVLVVSPSNSARQTVTC